MSDHHIRDEKLFILYQFINLQRFQVLKYFNTKHLIPHYSNADHDHHDHPLTQHPDTMGGGGGISGITRGKSGGRNEDIMEDKISCQES